jgi:hypothetical protein
MSCLSEELSEATGLDALACGVLDAAADSAVLSGLAFVETLVAVGAAEALLTEVALTVAFPVCA